MLIELVVDMYLSKGRRAIFEAFADEKQRDQLLRDYGVDPRSLIVPMEVLVALEVWQLVHKEDGNQSVLTWGNDSTTMHIKNFTPDEKAPNETFTLTVKGNGFTEESLVLLYTKKKNARESAQTTKFVDETTLRVEKLKLKAGSYFVSVAESAESLEKRNPTGARTKKKLEIKEPDEK